ncbi:VOC family protein [Nonomuraea basaltis]|uniref:VOC family protein n=1 Tax=Nonomuraea basaltis TaxID=2495887 RepID=UPI00110C4A03|nr:VOC family protein [Nonomuraea basaltis]TMR99389.1 VOC family protein [Nonomuraea basaltis]
MAYDFQVVIDTNDPHALADWWADALGWQVEPQDETFIRQMIEKGYATDDDTTTHRGALVWKSGTAIRHPDGLERAPRVLFQQVPEPKTVKNRVHLDIRVGADNIESVVEKLTAKGAKVLHRGRQGPNWWITIADPEGNELCIT